MVLQNQQGQQFPVSLDAVQQFLIRWPTSPDRLAPDALAVVDGLNRNSNQVLADHVDVFQGPTKSLVPAPSRGPLNENGDYIFPLLMDTYETGFGGNFRRWPVDGLPLSLDVIGQVVNRYPLVVRLPDNTLIKVLGPQGIPPMTLVTFGSPTFVRSGDLVWYLATGANPRTLGLEQLIVYKTVPYGP